MNIKDIRLADWFETVSQCAKANKVSTQLIRKMISTGKLMASKIGATWILPKEQKWERKK